MKFDYIPADNAAHRPKYNEYDEIIQDLRYFANDKRRAPFYRDTIKQAIDALDAQNKELKNAQNLLSDIKNAISLIIYVFNELEKYQIEGGKTE